MYSELHERGESETKGIEDVLMYSLEGKQLTREEVRVIVAEAHVWQKRADLRRTDLSKTNLIGADLREADLERANLSGTRLDNAILLHAVLEGANMQNAQL
ncbi:MAG: hypothetical protein AUI36_36765 [Cyanobacteria bacterium 13_1_40CM_2_61_4]|nr:MAG: hypothetical protein AUI36_36765 [Cyanobacteria bacterium 13_1_40CM_2_61_4]